MTTKNPKPARLFVSLLVPGRPVYYTVGSWSTGSMAVMV